MAAAQRSIRRLETPGYECGESARLFLQFKEPLKVIHAMFKALAHPEHHGSGRAHAELVRRAVHADPVFGQAFQAGNLIAHLVIQNLRAATRNRIEPGIAQAHDRIPQTEVAVFRNRQNLRRRVAMQMDFRKALANAAQHLLVPLDFQVRMQTALHQNACAAQLHRFADLVVDRLELQDVAFLSGRSFQWPVERAKGAVLRAEVRVIDVAVDNVGDHALGMQLAPHRIRFHPNADQIIGPEHLDGLFFGQRHISLDATPYCPFLSFRRRTRRRNLRSHHGFTQF